MHSSTRIIVNTGILYGKMVISIIIALFSTRLILNALGANDFGIFTVVAGVIGGLSFLNKAMATATQRYLSYNIGKSSNETAKIFNNALLLHVFIGILFVTILEIAGLFLFNGFLNIDENRIPIAKFIFHCSVASTFFTVIAVPYDAIMNAKENMLIFAFFSILESVFKLLIGIFLYYTPSDRLATYGLLLALSAVLCRTLKRFYSRIHYPQSKLNLALIDWKLLKEMACYSGWITLESICHIAKGEGIPIILNLFFGTIINAAYGIALQVRQNISFFSEMIFRASNPQVMKNIGAGNLGNSIRLSFTVCKFSYFLMAILSIPLIIKADYVLELWLKNVPNYAVLFCQLTLATNLIIMLARGLNFLIDGIGKIRAYRITLSILNLLVFPLAYAFLKYGAPAYTVCIAIMASDVAVVVARVYFANKYSHMGAMIFCKQTILPLTTISTIVYLLTYFTQNIWNFHPFINLTITTIFSSILLTFSFYTWALDKNERASLKEFIRKCFKKISPLT